MFLVFPPGFITDTPPEFRIDLDLPHLSAVLRYESRCAALELYCLISADDRVSRAAVSDCSAVSGCSVVCLGALPHARVLLSVSAILIGGHHVSVHDVPTSVPNHLSSFC